MHRGSNTTTNTDTSFNHGYCSRPNGLRTPGCPSRCPGANTNVTWIKTIVAPANHANGRHLLEGSLPSGNNRTVYTPSSPTGITQIAWVSASRVTEELTAPVLASS